jgi:hypothetical protein
VATCNLGKVNLETMLASSLPQWVRQCVGVGPGYNRGRHMCLVCISSFMAFCWSLRITDCHSRLCLCWSLQIIAPTLLSPNVSIGKGKYSTESSVCQVPGGRLGQGCHGYLAVMHGHARPALQPSRHLTPSSSIGDELKNRLFFHW